MTSKSKSGRTTKILIQAIESALKKPTVFMSGDLTADAIADRVDRLCGASSGLRIVSAESKDLPRHEASYRSQGFEVFLDHVEHALGRKKRTL